VYRLCPFMSFGTRCGRRFPNVPGCFSRQSFLAPRLDANPSQRGRELAVNVDGNSSTRMRLKMPIRATELEWNAVFFEDAAVVILSASITEAARDDFYLGTSIASWNSVGHAPPGHISLGPVMLPGRSTFSRFHLLPGWPIVDEEAGIFPAKLSSAFSWSSRTLRSSVSAAALFPSA